MPYIEARNASAKFEHEATTTRLSDDQLFYVMQRGLSQEEAVALLVNGFVRRGAAGTANGVRRRGPEAGVAISLEGSVG